MEDNFYLDDFELSLKEQANQFKMIPSKRIWHGIYNDMHPGRRWPSVTIALLLIISIVFVGYINTHNDKKLIESQVQTAANKNKIDKSQRAFVVRNPQVGEKFTHDKNDFKVTTTKQEKNIASASSISSTNEPNISSDKNNIWGVIAHQNHTPVADIALLENTKNSILPEVLKNEDAYAGNEILNFQPVNFSKEIRKIDGLKKISDNKSNTTLNVKEDKESTIDDGTDKKQVTVSENNIPYNKELPNELRRINAESSILILPPVSTQNAIKKTRKKNGKTTWVYYAGPFVSTVAFNGKHLNENINQNSLSLPQVTPKDIRIIHNPALGFEAGIQMNYLVAKKLQLTVGAHFTLSGYNIISNEVHPTLTSLLLKDKARGNIYSRDFVTHFGDGTGQSTIRLHNYSYQVSIPLGVQYELWENGKIQINLAANIDPSLVLKSNAYILSTDGRNYVNIPDLYRKLNLSSNFGPFITFKSSKFKWNIGPTIRYQWLSSYLGDYTIKEHLIDYGIRVGISK